MSRSSLLSVVGMILLIGLGGMLVGCDDNPTTIQPPVDTPTFSSPAGTYTTPQTVTISSATAGATIRYTTDGTDPTEASTLYEAPVVIAESATLKAKAWKADMMASKIATAAYVINLLTVETPTLSPESGTFPFTQTVTIASATTGATIRYTTDGSIPTETSTEYTAALELDATTTVRAKAWMTDMLPSEVVEGTYTLVPPVADAPTFDPAPGDYMTAQAVTLATALDGGVIHYTTNGTQPTADSPVYSTPLVIDETTIIKALTTKTGYTASAVKSGTYTFKTVSTPVISPEAGTYNFTQMVELTSPTEGATIRYTLDNTEPAIFSPIYTEPIEVSKSTTVKAKAWKEGSTPSATARARFVIKIETVATPTFSPASATFNNIQAVTISSETPEATIRYTTDGSDPTAESTEYTGPIELSKATVLKAKAFKFRWYDSEIRTASYDFVVSNPTFEPISGSFTTIQTVAISCATADAVIRYTMDGSDPTEESLEYTAPIEEIDSDTTIKAKAWFGEFTPSKTVAGVYDINLPTVAKPAFDPVAGLYTMPLTVTITSATEGAAIYYTDDGSEPTQESTEYTGSIEVKKTKTLKAKAWKYGYLESAIGTATFVNDIPSVETPTFDPVAGTYNEEQVVTIATTTDSSKIFYTIDGSEPFPNVEGTFEYTAPVAVDGSMRLRAKAFRGGDIDTLVTEYNPSEEVQGDYVLQPIAPTFGLAPGDYTGAQTVSLSTTTVDAKVHYTTTGNAPTANSPEYTAPFEVAVSTTVKAIAVKFNWHDTEVVEGGYQITPADPTFNVAGGTYDAPQTIELSPPADTPTANIRYTTDGNDPTISSPFYSAPIVISNPLTTIKAIATLPTLEGSDLLLSGVVSETYTINLAHNKIGIYLDNAGTGASEIVSPANVPVTIYLVINDPYNEKLSTDITSVSGFECRVEFPTTGFFRLSQTIPNGLNLGSEPDYIWGFNSPYPSVTTGAVLLATWQILPQDADPKIIYLGPIDGAPASVTGQMSYLDAVASNEDNLQAVYPILGYDLEVDGLKKSTAFVVNPAK